VRLLINTLWDSVWALCDCWLTLWDSDSVWLLRDSEDSAETLCDCWLSLRRLCKTARLLINSVRLCVDSDCGWLDSETLINSVRLCVTLCDCWLTLWDSVDSGLSSLWDSVWLLINSVRLWETSSCWLTLETLWLFGDSENFTRLLINSERLWKTLKDFARLVNSVRLWRLYKTVDLQGWDCWLTLWDSVRLCVTVD
jgi:hypothetical protein